MDSSMGKNILILILFSLLFSCTPSQPNWKLIAPMPNGRYWHDALLGKDEKIYIMGGMQYEVGGLSPIYNCPYSVLSYDIKKNTWEYLNPVPGYYRFSMFYYYDDTKHSWEAAKRKFEVDRKTGKIITIDRPGRFKDFKGKTRDTDFHRQGYGVAILQLNDGNILWLGGNFFGDDSENLVLTYYPALDEWTKVTYEKYPVPTHLKYHTTMPPMIEKRTCHGAVMTRDGKIYVMGGGRCKPQNCEFKIVTNTVECYNPKTNKWSYMKPMKYKKMLFGSTIGPDGLIYVFGGSEGAPGMLGTKRLDAVEVYNPAKDTWSLRKPMPEKFSGLRAVLAKNGLIYVLGGYFGDNERPLKSVYIYNPANDSWKKGPDMNVARGALAAVATPDGKIYAIGGSSMGINPIRGEINDTLFENRFDNGHVQETVEVLDISK
jgi:N-acetylneuraminic acid mutarotase